MKKKYTCIDLFAGAGGLSEGFLETDKFDFLAHVEWEKPMVDTLRNNLVKRWNYSEEEAEKRVILFDIQRTEELLSGNWSEETRNLYSSYNSPDVVKYGINGLVGDSNVDVIIGGPPCQAYSIAGRAQDPNSMKDDYRNYLFESFVKVVAAYKPEVFVFENVPGMLSAAPGDKLVIERIYNAFNDIGYEIRRPYDLKQSVYTASDFSVPQDRKRVIIIGVRCDSDYEVEEFYDSLNLRRNPEKKLTVRDAIGDMPKFRPLDEPIKDGRRNVSHIQISGEQIPLHKARYNNLRDINVFRIWIANNMNNASTEDKLNFYKKITGKTSNHNKYRNIDWDKPSPTIVSHLYKDGLMFIHPDVEQARTITIREAALLQSFPIDFEFVGSDAYCFKMIGNAVPVLFAREIANAIIDVMEK